MKQGHVIELAIGELYKKQVCIKMTMIVRFLPKSSSMSCPGFIQIL